MSSHQHRRLKLLSEVEVLEPLSAEELESLSQRTLERNYQIGEDIYVPGDASEFVYFLLEGRIRLFGMVGGEELTFEIIHSGVMFGVASLLEHTQDEYAQALEPSRIGLLKLNAFWDLLRGTPEVNAKVMRLLGRRLRSSRRQMLDIALKEVPARLAGLILALVHEEGVVTSEGHYRISTHYTHEQLATMVGAKRVAVTRAFGRLQERGVVRLEGRRMYITDLVALSRFSVGR